MLTRLSAIVVNYRNAADTAGCVASLLADAPDTDVLVVDNSADALHTQALRAVLPQGVRLLISESNLGFGAACNRAWSQCHSDEVMLINPDARLFPGGLRLLQSALREARKHGHRLAAVSPLQVWDDAGAWMLPPAWLPTGIGLWTLTRASQSVRDAQRLSRVYRRLALSVWLAASQTGVVPQRALSGGAMMVRRDAIESAGGLFDPRYFMYYEDSDLCWRLRRGGWHLGMVPAARVLHAWAHSGDKAALMEQAQRQYLAAHFEGHGQWERRLHVAQTQPALTDPLEAARDGPTPTWEVPETTQSAWLLEVSPSPLLVPAIGHWGHGPQAGLPAHLRERMGPGLVYGRVTPRP